MRGEIRDRSRRRQVRTPRALGREMPAVLERARRRLSRPARAFWLLALPREAPGVVPLVLGHGWVSALGIALVVLEALPLIVAVGLGIAGTVAWSAARRKPFA